MSCRAILVVFLCSSLSWSCSKEKPPSNDVSANSNTEKPSAKADAAANADSLNVSEMELLEGLPHHRFKELVEKEKKRKKVLKVGAYFLYEEVLKLNAADRKTLAKVIVDPKSLQPFSGAKKCGGFHPDYALRWSAEGKTKVFLICFGCNEAIIVSGGEENKYDLGNDATKILRDVLLPYRKNRPEK